MLRIALSSVTALRLAASALVADNPAFQASNPDIASGKPVTAKFR